MNLISVEKATEIIHSQKFNFGTEEVDLSIALGRILAENLVADRDFPPFHRVTMDGIAIDFEAFLAGIRSFKIEGLQAAGDVQMQLNHPNACLEVMTGAYLPLNTDTVIRYEDLDISESYAKVLIDVNKGQNIHKKGSDCLEKDIIVKAGKRINAGDLAIAATIGKVKIWVKAFPKIVVISSGDELVKIHETPLAHQIRGSNVYAIQGLLASMGAKATHWHCKDDLDTTKSTIKNALKEFDVLILSGGVSMGKKDYIPNALAENGVNQHFHKISQKPGKPMWFGGTKNNVVFALPGNPVSTFMCTIKYVLPWLSSTLGLENKAGKAILAEDVKFKPALSYFLQVQVKNENGKLMAYPISHQGSGDFINLSEANAFIELPQRAEEEYQKGEIFSIYTF